MIGEFDQPALAPAEVDFRLTIQPGRLAVVRPPHCVIALGDKRTVVDAIDNADMLQRLVLVLGPKSAPLNKGLVAVPLAGLHPPQSRRGRLPQGEHDVGVVIMRMVALFRYGCMNGDIGDHALAHEGGLDEA